MLRPPESESELLNRAKLITGKTLQHIANINGWVVPANQKHAKGWAGDLIEYSLGGSATTRPEPDFREIGVELKTIPINRNGRPKESTYVCTVPLTKGNISWDTSPVKRKLTRVLWVPIEADISIPIGERRIGTAILWSPDKQQETVLRNDWEELNYMIQTGELDKITSSHGQYLQIRPKAANSKSLRQGIGSNGIHIQTLPRGFYLRITFTNQIINQVKSNILC